MTNPKLGQPVKNRYKVPQKMWREWSNHAKKVFNTMMDTMRPSMQFAFLHPDCPPMKKEHWATTRWNVSWEAAQAANGGRRLDRATTVKRDSKKQGVRRGK